jgi:hypothetical protein
LSALDHGFHGELHMLEEQTRIVFRCALPSRVAIGWPSACPLDVREMEHACSHLWRLKMSPEPRVIVEANDARAIGDQQAAASSTRGC